jgi:hypothetical protein
MLPDLHATLQRLIHERGQIDPAEVDVRFDAPTKDWIERLTRPTVSCFLHDLRENAALRQSTFQTTRVNGRSERRLAPRRIDAHYLVSAHASEPEDEHRLLWRVLATLLRHPEIPADVLPAALVAPDPPLATRIADPDDTTRSLDLWNAALNYVVTMPLDLDVTLEAPLVLTRILRFPRGNGETSTRIAGIVSDRDGTPLPGITVAREGSAVGAVTDREGRFALSNVPHGPLRLFVARPGTDPQAVALTVPSARYDVTLD